MEANRSGDGLSDHQGLMARQDYTTIGILKATLKWLQRRAKREDRSARSALQVILEAEKQREEMARLRTP